MHFWVSAETPDRPNALTWLRVYKDLDQKSREVCETETVRRCHHPCTPPETNAVTITKVTATDQQVQFCHKRHEC